MKRELIEDRFMALLEKIDEFQERHDFRGYYSYWIEEYVPSEHRLVYQSIHDIYKMIQSGSSDKEILEKYGAEKDDLFIHQTKFGRRYFFKDRTNDLVVLQNNIVEAKKAHYFAHNS